MSISSFGSKQKFGLDDDYLESIMDVKQINGHAANINPPPNFGIPRKYFELKIIAKSISFVLSKVTF